MLPSLGGVSDRELSKLIVLVFVLLRAVQGLGLLICLFVLWLLTAHNFLNFCVKPLQSSVWVRATCLPFSFDFVAFTQHSAEAASIEIF